MSPPAFITCALFQLPRSYSRSIRERLCSSQNVETMQVTHFAHPATPPSRSLERNPIPPKTHHRLARASTTPRSIVRPQEQGRRDHRHGKTFSQLPSGSQICSPLPSRDLTAVGPAAKARLGHLFAPTSSSRQGRSTPADSGGRTICRMV